MSVVSLNDSKPVNKRHYREEKRSLSIASGLEEELRAERIEFELEKLKNERNHWEERRNREGKEKIEQDERIRLKESQSREGMRRSEGLERRKRIRIDYVKGEITSNVRRFLLLNMIGEVLMEIEKTLSPMDVLNLSISELIIYGQMVKHRVLNKHGSEVVAAAQNHIREIGLEVAEDLLKGVMAKLHHEFLKTGNWDTAEEFRKFVSSQDRELAEQLISWRLL